MVVTPADAGPLTLAVKELAGISGDDYTVKVAVPGRAGAGTTTTEAPAELVISRLGHDGPTLAESLRRDWLRARTDILRLGGSGEGWFVAGQIAGLGGPAPEPFRGLLFEDVLVVAREGCDLAPVFLALLESVSFEEATYVLQATEWPGLKLWFSKLAKQTDEFVKRLGENRSLLAKEAAGTLSAALPTLPADGRGVLAGTWMPGRLMELARMDGLCSGFEAGFRGGWLASVLRHDEGSYLLDWASPTGTWLGCTREQEDSAVGAGDAGDAGGKGSAERPVWMLAGRKGIWFLEPLSIEDHATYCFEGGDELPALVSRLLCAPQFSKEALYNPLEALTGDNADLAIAAVSLDFLIQLRRCFQARVIHQSVEAWRKEVERLSS